MSLKPLWVFVLLVFLFWKVDRVVPYAATLARVCIVCTAILVLPFIFYAVFHEVNYPSNDKQVLTLGVMGGIGLFTGLIEAGVCLLLDAKRRP